NKILLTKNVSPSLLSRVETVSAEWEEIEIRGYQFYENEDMINLAATIHSMVFADVNLGTKFEFPLTTEKRTDITSAHPTHNGNYDSSGYVTSDALSMATIPGGIYEMNIRTQVINTDLDSMQVAIIDSIDQILSTATIDTSTYEFYIENNKIYLEKVEYPVTRILAVESIIPVGDEVIIKGYQIYKSHEMGSQAEVEHYLVYKDVATREEYKFPLKTVERPDVTSRYASHNTNYDYSGFDSQGSINISSLPKESTYDLYIRTRIIGTKMDFSKANGESTTIFSNVGAHEGEDVFNKVVYEFDKKGNLDIGESKYVPDFVMVEDISFAWTGNGNSSAPYITLDGYMMTDGIPSHASDGYSLLFPNLSRCRPMSARATLVNNTDITNMYPSHNTNYDYASYNVTREIIDVATTHTSGELCTAPLMLYQNGRAVPVYVDASKYLPNSVLYDKFVSNAYHRWTENTRITVGTDGKVNGYWLKTIN
ncbi:MAG: hypothetical protein JJV90_00135, partial [Spiroplasma sp.]|nr:hypothetical protein [Mycoplasmatales bacterium]